MSKTWFITGATRGMGTEFAKAALAAGYNVIATGRRLEALNEALGTSENLLSVALDVADLDQAKAAVSAAMQRHRRAS